MIVCLSTSIFSSLDLNTSLSFTAYLTANENFPCAGARRKTTICVYRDVVDAAWIFPEYQVSDYSSSVQMYFPSGIGIKQCLNDIPGDIDDHRKSLSGSILMFFSLFSTSGFSPEVVRNFSSFISPNHYSGREYSCARNLIPGCNEDDYGFIFSDIPFIAAETAHDPTLTSSKTFTLIDCLHLFHWSDFLSLKQYIDSEIIRECAANSFFVSRAKRDHPHGVHGKTFPDENIIIVPLADLITGIANGDDVPADRYTALNASYPNSAVESTSCSSMDTESNYSNTEPYHSDGPCLIWWPVNQSEIFLHSLPRRKGTAKIEEAIFACPELNKWFPQGKAYRKHENLQSLEEDYKLLFRQLKIAGQERESKGAEDSSLSGQYRERKILHERLISIPSSWSGEEPVVVHVPYLIPDELYESSRSGRREVYAEFEICSMTKMACFARFSFVLRFVLGTDIELPGFNRDVRQSPLFLHPMVSQIDDRDDLGYALPMLLPWAKSMIEVGAQFGKFSELMMLTWPGCERYILVDNWGKHSASSRKMYEGKEGRWGYWDSANVNDQESIYNDAVERVQRLNSSVPIILRMSSLDAASIIADESVDIVYIDALHHYRAVIADLYAWWPKVRKGGILAGHDYLVGYLYDTVFTVKPAVNEFARRFGLIVFQTIADSAPTWYIFKPH